MFRVTVEKADDDSRVWVTVHNKRLAAVLRLAQAQKTGECMYAGHWPKFLADRHAIECWQWSRIRYGGQLWELSQIIHMTLEEPGSRTINAIHDAAA